MAERATKKKKREESNKLPGLQLRTINPLTDNQRLVFESWEDGAHLFLSGCPGTGKTFLSIYLALKEIQNDPTLHKVVIIRSVVPTREIGHLPGTIAEKSAVYESPYVSIFHELYGRGDAYELMKTKDQVEFMITSFLRGSTIDNCVVVVDEMSNCNYHELCSIITRFGKNCRVIFAGDYWQSDLKHYEKEGVLSFIKIIREMESFDYIEFVEDDICRSELVKEFIITRNRLEL